LNAPTIHAFAHFGWVHMIKAPEGIMPITAFNSFTDGLDPNRRSREHFVTNAGEAHTLVITEDSPEPALVMFVVEGGLIYLDKPVNGGVAAYEDGFTLLDLTRKYYREAGLDAKQLDLLIR
jgi:hypothetical protein